jgi:uncharacterized protein YndB with AHSA1/START domain
MATASCRSTPERVYKAFWTPMRWSSGCRPTLHGQDAPDGRQGRGTYRIVVHELHTGKSHSIRGSFLELTPNERLRYTGQFDDPNLPGEIQVTGDAEEGRGRAPR